MADKIYTINDWWGGPLCGVADYNKTKFIYQRRFDEEMDMYTNDYFLTPVTEEDFEKIMADWNYWISLCKQGKTAEYSRTDSNNVNKIAEIQPLYHCCVLKGEFFINEHFNSQLENSYVEWSESEYNIPETYEAMMGRLYDCYYEDFNWMILSSDNEYYINQLNKEVNSGHDLYGMKLIPEAKSEMNDDVIFSAYENNEKIYYLIHFTYSNYTTAEYPVYKKLGNLEQLEEYLISTIQM
ncbi:MAG: hypothetical protein IJ362_03485 [Oscillospiraceae bacterium]|nr:hypothetical protein [Oscillospiraceae bacterium]